MNPFRPNRRKPSSGARADKASRSGLAFKDRLTDALSPSSIRRRFIELQRKSGITRSGQIAIVGFVFLWITARVVAGKAIFIFAYGVLLLLGVAFVIAPRKLKLVGD